MDAPSELSRILYHRIIGPGRKPRTPSVEQLASELQKSAVWLYKTLEGEIPLTDRTLILIYRAMRRANGEGPIDALQYLVTECDPHLYLIDSRAIGKPDGQLLDNVLQVGASHGALLQTVKDAITDGLNTSDETQAIVAAASEQHAQVDGLVQEAEHLAKQTEIRRTA